MSSTNKATGFLIALIAGCLGLLAFFALPFVSVLGVGITALQFASGNIGGVQINTTPVLWVELLLAGAVALIAGLQFRSSATLAAKKKAGGWLRTLGIVGTILCILALLLLASASSIIGVGLFSLLGIGFWAFLIAMIGAIVGGVMARKSVAAQGGVAVPPPVNYPQYQQPPSPQYPQYQQPSSPQYPPAQPSSGGQQWPPKQ